MSARPVTDVLGIRVHPTHCAAGVQVGELLGLAVRRNLRRAHLLVSTVLGKHVPTDPRLVYGSGRLLGGMVADGLAGQPVRVPASTSRLLRAALAGGDAAALCAAVAAPAAPADALVLGFAETATALGHTVADSLSGADYLHSTRRPVPGVATLGEFTEEHSHATGHLLQPLDPTLLAGDRPLVLVDDELSTGATALNTIRAVHRLAPRRRYMIAALVDVRSPAESAALDQAVRSLGARLTVVSLAGGRIELPAVLARHRADLGADQRATFEPAPPVDPDHRPGPESGRVELTDLGWPDALLPVGGRGGFTPAHRSVLDRMLPMLGEALAGAVAARPGDRVLVLGTEELMYLPLRLALTLADAHPDAVVCSSTTTRSPVLVVAASGYAVTSGVEFPAHDDPPDGPGPRYAYNLGLSGSPRWDRVVLVVDRAGDTPALHAPDGLLAALRPHAARILLVVTP